MHFFRALHDTQSLRNPCQPDCLRAAWTRRRLALPKGFNQVFLQPTARVGIDAGVAGHVADTLAGIVRMQVAKLGIDLLERPAVQHQMITNERRQVAALDQPRLPSTA